MFNFNHIQSFNLCDVFYREKNLVSPQTLEGTSLFLVSRIFRYKKSFGFSFLTPFYFKYIYIFLQATKTTKMTDNKDCKSLVIRNLDPKVTEEALKGIFALISPVESVKITNDDKNVR
jgi:hypothetical protein